MAVPGWYPDPGGHPDRHRYWDGARWSDRTRPAAAVGASPPAPGSPPPGSPPPGRPVLLLGAVALVLIILAVVVVFNLPDRSSTDEDPVPPPSTVSAWDETSSPDPSAARPVDCDLATTDQLPAPPRDGRTHGGPLSFASLPGDWTPPQDTRRFPFSRDSHVQTQRIASERDLGWQASAQAGVVEMKDYPGAEPAANVLLQCLMTSDFYRNVDVTLAESDHSAVDISGTTGARVDALLSFEHPDLITTGSRVRILVVESDPVTYYFHAVPKETDDLIAELDTATDSLALG